MKVTDLMVRDVKFISPSESVARAISLMESNRFHQLPAVEHGNLLGMVFLKSLIGKRIDPERTRVRNFIVSTYTLSPSQEVEQAQKILIGTGLRALPVVKGRKLVGILSETDVIKRLRPEITKNLKAVDVMSKPIVIDENRPISSARVLMSRHNISTLPVVDWEGKLVGCVNLFSLATISRIPKERVSVSLTSAKERISFESNPVKVIASQAISVSKDESLSTIITFFGKCDEVIVTESNTPVGVIVPKDVLELSVSRARLPIQISNLEEGNEWVMAVLKEFMEKWRKSFKRIEYLTVYFDIYKRGGKRRKYSARARLFTSEGLFVVKAHGWHLGRVTKELIERFEKTFERRLRKREEAIRQKLKQKFMG